MAGILRDAALSALTVWEALSATIVPDDGAGLLSPRLAYDVRAIQAAMAELRRLLPAPARDYDPRPYIAANHWVFARTMPDNPHEYVVIHDSTDPYEHLMFLEWIRSVGDIEHYRGRDYEYVTVDGYRYWAMGPSGPEHTIINRREAPKAISRVTTNKFSTLVT